MFCACGCGGLSPIATHTDRRWGAVRGKPRKFIQGHQWRPRRTTAERFWSKVIRLSDAGCWLWTSAQDGRGYGTFGRPGGRQRSHNLRAHRVAYELLVGPIPAGLEIDHLCRVPLCVNPAHLEPVTRRENILRGIGPQTISARVVTQTHCKRGHLYDDKNTRWTRAGTRACRACLAIGARRRWAAARALSPLEPPTHCPNGHPYDSVNLRYQKGVRQGIRQCQTCRKERYARYEARLAHL